MFQSLIGRLGTVGVAVGVGVAAVFQSLIGRLGTRGRLLPGIGAESEFQSLIGRLGTHTYGTCKSGHARVSIPHR